MTHTAHTLAIATLARLDRLAELREEHAAVDVARHRQGLYAQERAALARLQERIGAELMRLDPSILAA